MGLGVQEHAVANVLEADDARARIGVVCRFQVGAKGAIGDCMFNGGGDLLQGDQGPAGRQSSCLFRLVGSVVVHTASAQFISEISVGSRSPKSWWALPRLPRWPS